MAFDRMFDLAWEVNEAGDGVTIEQDGGAGEVDRIALHSLHVRLLAGELGLLQGDSDAWRRVDALERRMLVLRDRIGELHALLASVPTFPSGSPTADVVYSEATLTLAEEWCADIPAATPEGGQRTERQQ